MEKALHLQRIEILRDLVGEILTAAPDKALNWVPEIGETPDKFNSLAALATHIAGTERYWISEVIGKRPSERNREAEFAATASDHQPLVRLLETTGIESRAIITALADSDLDRLLDVDDEKLSIRWILMQVASHTAIHYGQMQMTYQLWNNGKMYRDVRWKSMLPARKKALSWSK